MYLLPSASCCAQGNSFFLDKVTTWQRNLGAVDSVLSTWSDVQKKWAALESIFVGSADIRTQLPDDSRRFDILNTNFQAMKTSMPLLMHAIWCSPSVCIVQPQYLGLVPVHSTSHVLCGH